MCHCYSSNNIQFLTIIYHFFNQVFFPQIDRYVQTHSVQKILLINQECAHSRLTASPQPTVYTHVVDRLL